MAYFTTNDLFSRYFCRVFQITGEFHPIPVVDECTDHFFGSTVKYCTLHRRNRIQVFVSWMYYWVRSVKLHFVKNNNLRIDKRYKAAGYSKDWSIARLIGTWSKKKINVLNLHRSSCVGEVIRRIVEQNNVQRSAFTPKKRKKFRF